MSPSTLALSPAEEVEALAALSGAYLDWHAASREAAAGGAAPPEPPEWLPQMRCLVQAGVPKVRYHCDTEKTFASQQGLDAGSCLPLEQLIDVRPG